MDLGTQEVLERQFVSSSFSKLFCFILLYLNHFASFCVFQEAEVAGNVNAPPGFPHVDRVTITIDPTTCRLGTMEFQ
jgi:hypothetical protein